MIYPPLYWELLSNFYKVIGISVHSLIAISYLVVIVSDILLWKASDKKFLPLIIFIPLQVFFEGNGLWVDQLLAPIFLGAYISIKEKKWLLLGVLLGLSLLVKQTAIYFAILMFFISGNKLKTVSGGALVGFFSLMYFLINQNFLGFVESGVKYILLFHSGYELQRQLPNLYQMAVIIIIFAPAILTGLFKRKFLLLGILVTASMGIFTRFEFFHFQPSLPFLAMLLAISPIGILAWGMFLIFFLRYFITSFHQPPRFDLTNRLKVSREKTLFINTWDQGYFLTDTLPAGNFFVPSTPWTMDYPGNQEKIVENIKRFKPKILYMNDCFEVKEYCYKPKIITGYIQKNYLKVGKLADGTGIFKNNPMSRGEK